MEPSIFIEELKKIAKEAGQAILEIYGTNDFQIESKNDESPLTIADKKANDIICEGLEKLDQNYPIISEENKLLDYDVRKNYDRCWMVDPLDGTKEFIKRNGEFTVNIALIENGEVILGIVYIPVIDEMYYAAKGKGAFSWINNEEKQIHCKNFTMKDSGLKVVCSRSHLNDDTQDFVDSLESPELIAKGSSLKFLSIASGDADVYPRLAPTMEWDTAAAHIILQEAGGKVIDQGTKEALRYNKENLLNPFFIAYGAESLFE